MLTDKRTRTLFVGLDAACWPYVTPLLESGRLPALQRLMDTGTWGTLYSTLPALTPTAWASIITGKNPGKHGVFDMLQRRPGSYEFRPTNRSTRIGTPFWKWLNDQGIRTGLVNVPFTYPPEEVDGFMVCGFGTPKTAADIAAPAEALRWIQSNVAGYSSRGRLKELRKSTTLDDLLAGEREHQRQQVEIAIGLSRLYEVDVLIINLMLLDHTNHYAQTFRQIEQALGDTDDDLARLLEAFQPENVLLFSDHGSRRVQGDFLLHQWLLDERYVALQKRPPSEQQSALHTLLVQQGRRGRRSGSIEKVRRRVLQGALQRLPDSMTARLWRSIESAQPFARHFVEYGQELDFGRSQLFPGSTYSGNLYLNMAGVEPNGIVSAEYRPALQAELAGKLRRITAPEEDAPLFSAVYTPEELYHGPAAPYAPDLILDGYESPWNAKMTNPGLVKGSVQERYFLPQHGDAGWHSKDGIFVFAGPAFRRGPAGREGQVMDLPATLLYQHGVAVPDDYDGRVLLEAFTAGFRERRPLRYQPGEGETALPFETGYSDDEAADVLEHLRDLGYVD